MRTENFDFWHQKIENDPIAKARQQIQDVYDKKQKITLEQIIEIRQELEKVPNLIINFDETMTKTSTIKGVVDALQAMSKYVGLDIERRWQLFKAHLEDKQSDRSAVAFFYEEVLCGVDYADLQRV